MKQNTSLVNVSYCLDRYLNKLIDTVPVNAYIHIPFCRRRCYYCDFPVSIVGNRPSSNASTMVVEYLEALTAEIRLFSNNFHKKPLTTVFFGGGTPSILSAKQLATVITCLDKQFGIASDAEISMEIDPGTFNKEQLLGYLQAGINRLSLGVQTFDDKLLQVCGRSHSRTEVFQAIEIIRQVGVNNFSLDLISGLPYQSLSQCQDALDTAVAIGPKHLSCYDLVLEPVTAFGKQYQPGKKPLPDDETAAEMYRLTQQTLTKAEYQHYEISNYALAGYQCRHNRVYWKNLPFYGFGMGAASFINGKRFIRPRTRKEYYTWVKKGAEIDTPVISTDDWLLETLMLGLRLAEGVNISQFERPILDKIAVAMQPYIAKGWIEVKDKYSQKIALNSGNLTALNLNTETRLRLSDPEGFLFSNTILSDLFEALV
ncbi:radical SAM family heme chaperone HemW [Myxosarcina sp. GI1]|uniref:radical SAM family heme chaperone HemW n=1 Tax=Myxosarcina sp. GI1 TaxID=1541065 RepID=UPI00056B84C3|nr:radical SAM family heme chaperone HemW [Myxosarcina sp. GI1]